MQPVASHRRSAWTDGTGEKENPGLEEILEIIDETEDLVWTRRELRGC